MPNTTVYLIQVHERGERDPKWGRLLSAPSEVEALARAEDLSGKALAVAVVRVVLGEGDGRVVRTQLVRRWGVLPPGAFCEVSGFAVDVERDDDDVMLSHVLEDIVGPKHECDARVVASRTSNPSQSKKPDLGSK